MRPFWKKDKPPKATPSLAQRSKSFFKRQISKVGETVKKHSMKQFAWHTVDYPEIGKMYFYAYDPKYKKTLPMYDRLPLVIPIEYYPDGWLGMNLHYLPPTARFKFLQQLVKISGNPDMNDQTKLKLSYGLLKGVAKSKYFQPTIHRYLTAHVRSPISIINPEDWEAVVFLPTASWRKGKPY